MSLRTSAISAPRVAQKTINLTPKQAFRTDLKKANRPYFSWYNALAPKTVIAGWALTLVSIQIPAFLMPGIGILFEKLSNIRAKHLTKTEEPNLLRSMVRASGKLEPKSIARELLDHGSKTLNGKFLAQIKEADGTKFNEVTTLMQSRSFKAISTAKKIAKGLAWWVPFAAYNTAVYYGAGEGFSFFQ